MKTALQELVEEMEQSSLMFAPALALIKEKNFLEKEKEQILQSLNDGKAMALDNIENKSLEQYYNDTFNT